VTVGTAEHVILVGAFGSIAQLHCRLGRLAAEHGLWRVSTSHIIFWPAHATVIAPIADSFLLVARWISTCVGVALGCALHGQAATCCVRITRSVLKARRHHAEATIFATETLVLIRSAESIVLVKHVVNRVDNRGSWHMVGSAEDEILELREGAISVASALTLVVLQPV